MTANPLRALHALGQSVWLDDIRRAWLVDGTLARLIAEDGVCGVTSNPAIFEKAIAQHHDYDVAIAAAVRRGLDAGAIYEELVLEDIGRAAELLRPVHELSRGSDGFVSIEVSPHIAHDTRRTVEEAQRLWGLIDRPNVMIKVPATDAGLPAIRRLIAMGVNVNVTLLFSVVRYRAVFEACLAGLEDRAREGLQLDGLASVASFFLSRIDTLVDKRLDALGTGMARELRGQAAVACARLAFQTYKEIIASPRWQALTTQGAHPQRLLWASTSTKDPDYSDIKYVEALIGPDTVNTLPVETLNAYRDHGEPVVRIEHGLDAARTLSGRLTALGVDFDEAALQLEAEGVLKFAQSFDRLNASLAAAAK